MTNIEQLEKNFIDKNIVTKHQIEEKTFLSSELSEELLVNYLARQSSGNKDKPFGNSELSDMFMYSASHTIPIRLSHQLNGWDIVGTIRLYDDDTKTICLPVVLSTNRILEIKSQGKDNKYAIELAVLRYLSRQKTTSDINLAVIAVDRLFTNYKTMPTKMLNFIEIIDTHSDDEIEQMLIQRTTELTNAIESKKIPSICSNLRWHKRQSKNVNMTCKHYCNYNHVCKYAMTTDYVKVSKNSIIF